MFRNAFSWSRALTLSLLLPVVTDSPCAAGTELIPTYCRNAKPAGLPLPSSLPLNDYERQLYAFLFNREYKTNHWACDKSVRDTGPFVAGKYYGTHPAVRVYYSPEIIQWLVNDRTGPIADGAMIVKEMFEPPAAQYEEIRQSFPTNQPSGYEPLMDRLLSSWTVLVKDRQLSKDGWFWANPASPGPAGTNYAPQISQALVTYDFPFSFPSAGAGLGTCLRCHASAEKELTFSSTNNILGFGGEPLRFLNDNSWRTERFFTNRAQTLVEALARLPHLTNLFELPRWLRPWTDANAALNKATAPLAKLRGVHIPKAPAPTRQPGDFHLLQADKVFLATFPFKGIVTQARAFPGQSADRVEAGPSGAQQYITSDNCMGCHGGLGGAPYGVSMFVSTGPNYGDGFNVSEYGEWRWSPMGLAGRDPIFHTQLESELALLRAEFSTAQLEVLTNALVNTCLSCHGAMGQRQLEIDAKAGKTLPNGQPLNPEFKPEYFYLTQALESTNSAGVKNTTNQVDYAYHHYGALAREGISCAVCHHITQATPEQVNASPYTNALDFFLMVNTTGHYETSPTNQLDGPFVKVTEYPMETAMGITPKYNAFTKDSQMCGTCHTINLPNVDANTNRFPFLKDAETVAAFKPFPHSIEQATFLEWQNSSFASKTDPNSFKSCQDCHMPGGFKSRDGKIKIGQLTTQIATIQDTGYPAVENEAPPSKISAPFRDDYKRHELVGLNVFLLEMFSQFDRILGVAKSDYMTSAQNGNALAMDNMMRLAQEETVSLGLSLSPVASNNQLTATVTVTNLVGHRFPSGVAFRRAFLELLVVRTNTMEVLWGSGRTTSVGVIVDGQGNPLPTEFLDGTNGLAYQPHYQTITNESQVQIYEELIQDAKGKFTTSFIHRDAPIKDNRLLPRGWRDAHRLDPSVHSPIQREFLSATDPEGESVLADPDYQDQGPGFPGKDTLEYRVQLPPGLDMSGLMVKATMYYQAIPPSWLRQRFSQAPEGEATKRLYFVASRIDLSQTPIKDWKLPLVSRSAVINPAN